MKKWNLTSAIGCYKVCGTDSQEKAAQNQVKKIINTLHTNDISFCFETTYLGWPNVG